jgi:ergothioneine biosynthesis protein EgtB
MSRPTVEEVFAYRRHVDAAMEKLLNGPELSSRKDGSSLLELGLHHEQQHQELLLMDIKHIFWSNALRPVYRLRAPSWQREPPLLEWLSVPEGIYQIGAESSGFAFDNERPRHRVFLENFKLASRPVTNGEYLEFIGDGGYQNPLLWLSDGWDLLQNERWRAPLYWEQNGEGWRHMTLSGMREVDPREPVSHLSYYEADAYARWAGKRLPREAEWEVVAGEQEVQGNFLESGIFHPQSPLSDSGPFPWQLFGDVWEWTQSPYGPYPKFKPLSGALGEYNGKFMCNQMVLRGGCCWTPRSHARATYRNFFPPQSRWQCSGLRLAEDG